MISFLNECQKLFSIFKSILIYFSYDKNLQVESYNINIDGIKKVPLIIIFSGLRSNLGFTYLRKFRKT